MLSTDKQTSQMHLSHRAAPGATSYRGIPIHVKGLESKLRKTLAKTKAHVQSAYGYQSAHAHEEPPAPVAT